MMEEKKILQVGLIMPISPIDGCSAEHWADIKGILVDAVESIPQYRCQAKIVSEADDVGVIQKRIVQNIYSADIVICDVSCKNANVMFELGMRLAFDKPTVIVKDDMTNYSFDTQIIEHVEYPRDLRFTKIVEFKSKVAKKVTATYEDSRSNPDHSTFLKNFGEFKVATLKQTTVSSDNLILEVLTDIQNDVAILKRDRSRTKTPAQMTRLALLNSVKQAIALYAAQNKINISDLPEVSSPELFHYVVNFIEKTEGERLPNSYIIEAMRAILAENVVASESN